MNRLDDLRAFVGAATFLVIWLTGAPLQAQSVTATSAQAVSTAPALPLYDDRAGERDPHPMAAAGIGVKFGMAAIGAGDLTVSHGTRSYTGHVDGRRGMHLAVPISLGGDGFGWTIEPYMTRASATHTTRDASGAALGSTDTNLTAYGLYTGPAVNLQVARPLYVGFGVGVKAAYVSSTEFKLAFDAYGRVPLNATYYLSNSLALVAELGIGYGVSMYANKPTAVVSSTGKVTGMHEDMQLGKAFAWDCTLGVRLP